MNYRLPEVFIIQFTFSFQRERQNCLGVTRLFLFTCLRSGCFLSILSTALEQSKVLSFGHSLILFYLFTSIPILLYYIILSLIPLSYLVDQLFPLAHCHCFFLVQAHLPTFSLLPFPFSQGMVLWVPLSHHRTRSNQAYYSSINILQQRQGSVVLSYILNKSNTLNGRDYEQEIPHSENPVYKYIHF